MAQTKGGKNKQVKQPLPTTGKKGTQERSAQQKKKQTTKRNKSCSGGCCAWLLGSIVLVALIVGAINYDTHVNGKGVFEKSATGKILKNAGLLPHAEKAWFTGMGAGARGYKWAQANVPPYAKPFLDLSCDVLKLMRNSACNTWTILRTAIEAKLPVAAEFLERYVPGLPAKIGKVAVGTKDAYANLAERASVFFKTQVLVGRFSSENLNLALNRTRQTALEYLNLFHKKVDSYAKLQ